MNPYITFRDNDKEGRLQYYVLQREFPHFVGMISERPFESTLMQMPISGYNLWLVSAGTLRGNLVPGYNNLTEQMASVFESMAAWYKANRIDKDEKKYKKFKIIPNVSIAEQSRNGTT